TLPEGDAISSTMTLCYNMANVIPLVMVLSRGKKTGGISDDRLLLWLFVLGCLVCVALAGFWQVTLYNVSVVVLGASILSGVVGCTSIVHTFSFVAKSDPYYTSITSTGLTVSGILTALMGSAQAGMEEPQVSMFWLLVLPMQLVSVVSVILLGTERVQGMCKAEAPKSTRYENPVVSTRSWEWDQGVEAGCTTISLPLSAYLIPCAHMMWTSILIKTLTPSMLPYATERYDTDQAQVMSVLYVIFTAGNCMGRVASILNRGSPLTLNISQSILLATFAVCAIDTHLDVPALYLYAEVAAQSFIAGYTATIVYTMVTRPLYRAENGLVHGPLGVEQDKAVKRWIGLFNQGGSLIASGLGMGFSYLMG
ncbi:hypothetical protein KIPB_009376, partial [Kipferlia bialata]